jgi:hypothetical protein
VAIIAMPQASVSVPDESYSRNALW